MAPVKNIMDQVRSAVEKGDMAAVAAVIGDQSIEFTKRNSNLGVDIPELQVAKPYMYRYAQAFSGAKESALTKDIKEFFDAYFNAMTKTRDSALSGDKEGTKANFQNAENALMGAVSITLVHFFPNKGAQVEVVDKETLNGRLNSIKVTNITICPILIEISGVSWISHRKRAAWKRKSSGGKHEGDAPQREGGRVLIWGSYQEISLNRVELE
eukprot:745755-Hanusia_phi.AAC.4